MIGLGKQHGGLYYLSHPHSPSRAFSYTAFAQSDLWHKRLGQPSKAHIKTLAKSIPRITLCPSIDCNVCPLAKQTRLPISLSSISIVEPFELIHCDIWGSYRTASHSGAHYFLTIVDDFSRST